MDPFGRKVVQSTKENLERFYHLDEKEESATTSDLKKEEQEKEADNEASLEQGTVEDIEQQTDETKDEKKVKSKKKQKQEEEEEENEEAEQKQDVQAYVEVSISHHWLSIGLHHTKSKGLLCWHMWVSLWNKRGTMSKKQGVLLYADVIGKTYVPYV